MTTASRDTRGRLQAPKAAAFPLPKKGEKRVFILTSAQNNTGIHTKAWRNLLALAEYENARVLVSTFTYSKAPLVDANSKRKTAAEGSKEKEEWWHPALEPFLFDFHAELAPGLIWCGELQILPTVVDPIAGFQSYTGRASTIIPASKFAVECVPSPKNKGTKFIYTTGAITLRNYIQKKMGQKAEFHHGYGGLIVEVDSDGNWFVRQLNADSDGVIYDLDRCVKDGEVTTGHRPEALVWGDIHERQLEEGMRALAWGKGGILDTLKPRVQVMHDLLDFRSQNHHDRDDPWKTYAKHIIGRLDVAGEISDAAVFLRDEAVRDWCYTVVVCSNHDMALVRWMKEADFREDPLNARLLLQGNLAAYDAMANDDKAFYAVEWAFNHLDEAKGGGLVDVRFLRRDEEYLVKAGGGIELGMHGDKGANGAKGSLRGFAKTGRKCIVGDRHTPGLFEGAMQVGVMGSLDQGYNEGMSSWSHTNALVYPNGKRTLFTIWKGKYRA